LLSRVEEGRLVKDEDEVLRATRAQAAIVRTLTAETQREGRVTHEAADLRAQALEESARLVAAAENLVRWRSSRAPAPAEVLPPKDPAVVGQRRLRILVVEDDEQTRLAIARGLANKYDVLAVGDGVQGLLAAGAAPFDAIVTDIWMPEIDGVTMVERIRRMNAPAVVPVIFLTGETAPDRVAAGFSAGGTSYLVKPVDLDLLDLELGCVLGVPGE
jgi:CheY-like chemotaxis protein